ncbi:ABC-three component system middle component 1 [Tumebacillus permanentifrigoris]|uniref:Uncharacterized protein n=1 Tax=Tumebacillus permanentifrigoris TaxID=378543 RepID=A0A316DA37_9BACL|nr:ABC-three component system middle component 1 [Tumebacillus permanentifrigoris]PWK13839.1 hypothetical protein C7459_106119 [Tumebacillus permanentifrigoris]
MVDRLCAFLEQQPELVPLSDLRLRHLQAVYASRQHLFAVAGYAGEVELLQNWNRAAHQLAFKVQRNMPLELDALRWDMYLLLFVDADEVSAEVQKQIENNRFYFRKIVLTRADLAEELLRDRLPLWFGDQQAGARPTAVWFEEAQFLRKLEESVEEDAARQLGADFFANGVQDADELLQLLGEAVTTGGETDAATGD